METVADGQESAPANEGEPLLEWQVHPARLRPAAAVVSLGFIITVACLVQAAYHAIWLTALGGLLLLGATGEFLFPTRYRLTEAGAERRAWNGTQRVAWDDVKVAYRFEDGVKLSTLSRPGPLEAHRGLFLRWSGDGETVQRIVDQRATLRRRPAEGGDDRDPHGE